MARLPVLLLFVCLLLASGCGTRYTPLDVDASLRHAESVADYHLEEGNDYEAAMVADMIMGIDPDSFLAQDISDDLRDVARQRNALGYNKGIRPDFARPWWAHVLLYLPDRFLDGVDLVTFDLHFGFGAYVDAHVTHMLQAMLGARAISGIGLHQGRSLGVETAAESGIGILPFGAHTMVGSRAGTSGVATGQYGVAGFISPYAERFQYYEDYYAIGASVTAGILGVSVDVHPVQLGDFLLGIFTFDFLNDDLARTRGTRFSSLEKRLLLDLTRMSRSRKSISKYREWKVTNTSRSARKAFQDRPMPGYGGQPAYDPYRDRQYDNRYGGPDYGGQGYNSGGYGQQGYEGYAPGGNYQGGSYGYESAPPPAQVDPNTGRRGAYQPESY
ncbi:MAG: hypothetical protein RLY93_21035 [Sumerlaeia bacterium]